MAYGFQGLKSLGLEGEQTQEAPMSLPVKKPEYDPSGYASFAKPSVSDTKGEIKQSPRDIVTAKYGYTPGQMPGINKDVAGVQGTAFNNWDDTTKQSIRKSIAETPVVKKPSVKEAVKKAGYNPQESLGDLVETAKSNGGALSDEQISQYFPEFKGKEKAIGDYFATLNEKPDLTPEETQQYFPEFFESLQGGVSAGGKFGQLAQDKGERNDNLLPTLQTTNEATTTSGVLKEFGMNILKSGINLGSAVGNMALNPVDSAKTIGKLGIGTLQNIYEAATGDEQDGEYAQLASQVGQYFKDRYGSEEGFQKAAYEDPVGVFSDLASIVSGGASVAAKTVGTAGKVANVAGATKAATALEKVAQGASKVAKIADTIDPATQIMKAGGKVIGATGKIGAEAVDAATRKIAEGANEVYARKVTGLSQKAVDTFKSNPERRNVEVGQLTEDGLMKEVTDTIASEKSRLDETGKAYEAVRNKDVNVNVGSQLPDIKDKLSKYNISVAPDGKLNFADSALESDAAGQKAIQFAYDVAKRGEIPADIFLNKRLDISNSIDWRSGVSDTANKITKEIRNSLNEAGHRDIAGLGGLDETYGPQRKVWNQIAREFIDRETGGLKDSAKAKIMNMTNANREQLLGKIEQYFPDISLKVDALRTAREVDSLKGIKAGTYNKTAMIAGGAKAGYELGQRIAPGVGLIGAPLGAIAGFVATDPAYIIKRLRGLDVKVPEEILLKIQNKQKIANKEAAVLKTALQKAKKQSADKMGLEQKFKQFMQKEEKKPLALPEKTTTNLGTKKNPIVGKMPKGYEAKPLADFSNMEKIAGTAQDAPKKGYETKIGKVTEITHNGGANPTYRVKVEGSDKRHNIDEIGGVYKPKIEVKMPRQEKTDAPKQEPEGLKVAPGGKKEYYLKLIKEEYGIDINKMDVQDIPKLKEAINSRTPAKAEEILKGLQEKYKGKKFKLSRDAKALDVEDMPRGAKAAQAVIDKAKNEGYDAVRFIDKGFDTIEGQSKEFYDKIYKDGKAPRTTIVIDETKLVKEIDESKGLRTKKSMGLKVKDAELPPIEKSTPEYIEKYATDNMDSILSEYQEANGNVINLDDFRQYIDNKGRIAANDTHKAAKMLTNEYEKRIMASVKKGDKGAIVGGGSGGGKGTAVSQLGIKDKGYSVVFDKVEGSDQIKSMLDKGMSVDYYIVIPDPGKIVSNIVGRAKHGNKPEIGEIGRTLSIRSVGLQKHIEAADVFKKLQDIEEYKDKVTFYGVDNSGTKEQIKLIDVVDTIKRLEKYNDDIGSIKGHHIRKVAKKVLDSGGITKFQYDNLIKVLAPVLLLFGLGGSEDA